MLSIKENTATISIFGELTSMPHQLPFHTSYPALAQAIQEAQDSDVSEIIIDFNSPGGELHGIDVALNSLKSCTKPTIAYITGCCCSAAYYLASQCQRIVAAGPNIAVGSVGVIMQSINEKEYAKTHGVELFQLISTDSPDKRDETQEHFEKTYRGTIEEFYSTFVTAIAQGRNISEENIRRDFGKGAILTASQAFKVGMIDEIQEIKKQEKETTMTSEEMATAMASDAGMALKAMTMAFEKNTDLALNAKVWLDENLDTDPQENPTQETIAEPDTQDTKGVAAKVAETLRADAPISVASSLMPTVYEESEFTKFKRQIDSQAQANGINITHRYI